jgi:signal peptidase
MMRFINIFFYTIFVSLMLGVAGLLVGSMLPIPGNIELKIVKSGSMEPNIPTGSLVVVKPMSNYGIGDVITFGADTKTEIPTTHRIISFEADGTGRTAFRTKGDANEDPDADAVQRNEVIGRVAFHLPYVGFVLDFARQPLGFALLIGVPAALVIVEEVITIVKELKTGVRKRRRKEDGEDTDESHGSGLPGQGGTRLREVAGPEKLVYLRRRAMDEIFVPMVVQSRTWIREHTPRPKDAYGAATFVVLGVVFVSTMLSGGAKGTIAYFNDIERSIGNIFSAAECDDFREGSCQQLLIAQDEPAALRMALPEGETVLGESTSEEKEPEELSGGGGGGAPAPEEPQELEVPTEEPEEPAAPEGEAAQTAPIEPQTPVEPVPEPEPTPEPEPAPETPPEN